MVEFTNWTFYSNAHINVEMVNVLQWLKRVIKQIHKDGNGFLGVWQDLLCVPDKFMCEYPKSVHLVWSYLHPLNCNRKLSQESLNQSFVVPLLSLVSHDAIDSKESEEDVAYKNWTTRVHEHVAIRLHAVLPQQLPHVITTLQPALHTLLPDIPPLLVDKYTARYDALVNEWSKKIVLCGKYVLMKFWKTTKTSQKIPPPEFQFQLNGIIPWPLFYRRVHTIGGSWQQDLITHKELIFLNSSISSKAVNLVTHKHTKKKSHTHTHTHTHTHLHIHTHIYTHISQLVPV
jgi:hypothetical protein